MNTTTSAEAQLAADIIHTWKTDPTIRSDFGSLRAYSAFARNTLTERQRIAGAYRPPVATSAPAPAAAPAKPLEIGACTNSEPVRLNRSQPMTWPADLAQKLSQHHRRLHVDGKSYGDAFDEAKAIVVSENPDRFQ